MRIKIAFTLLAVLTGAAVFAQSSSRVPGPKDYAAFARFITERNIFDPNRQPHSGSARPPVTRPRTHVSASAPAFTLVGTMSYAKGIFAFFDGNSAELKKALPVSETIAGYTVTDISHGRVTLAATNQTEKLELKVGDVMREENGKWALAAPGELPAPTSVASPAAAATTEGAGSATASTPASASAPNDILKRLMEKREQENK